MRVGWKLVVVFLTSHTLTTPIIKQECGCFEALDAEKLDKPGPFISWCKGIRRNSGDCGVEGPETLKHMPSCGMKDEAKRAYKDVCLGQPATVAYNATCFKQKVEDCVREPNPAACKSDCLHPHFGLDEKPVFHADCLWYYAHCLNHQASPIKYSTALEDATSLKTFCLNYQNSNADKSVWACLLENLKSAKNPGTKAQAQAIRLDDVGTWCMTNTGLMSGNSKAYRSLTMDVRVYEKLCKIHLGHFSADNLDDCLRNKAHTCVTYPQPELCDQPCFHSKAIDIPIVIRPVPADDNTLPPSASTDTTAATTTTTTTESTTTTSTTQSHGGTMDLPTWMIFNSGVKATAVTVVIFITAAFPLLFPLILPHP